MRDPLRKRGHLVRLRTSLVISLQNILSRNLGVGMIVNDVKRLREDRITPLLEESEDLALAGVGNNREGAKSNKGGSL